MPSADKRQRKKENARAAKEAREAAEKRQKRMKGLRNAAITATVVIVGIVIFSYVLNQGDDDNSASDSSTTTLPADATTTTPTTAANVAYPAGCTDKAPAKSEKQTFDAEPPMTIDTAKTYVADVDTNCGTFDITLDAKDAPKTANSFVFLANKKFYDGLTWHRLVTDFVIQGGDPDGNGTGGPGYQLPDEPPANGYKKGSVAMANSGTGTTGSQFFVTVSDNGAKTLGTAPPYKYSSLGEVTKGFENVEKMMKLAAPSDGPPVKPLYINKITITES